ncbi:MAG: hypothetical protein NTZ05_11785 [Chloroflexi bacterium]|nr:hypothetical protein [Chloroflexota bacterium]
MAQVAQHSHRQPDIDWAINYQWGQWSDIPWYAEQWKEMDATDKNVFEMQKLIAQHRPTLEYMLAN